MNSFRLATLIVTTAAFGTCCGQDSTSSQLDYNPRTVLRRPLPAITDAKVTKVDPSGRAIVDDREIVTDNELVIGLELNGKARAYPINMLTGPRREIINDMLGGVPIATTW